MRVGMGRQTSQAAPARHQRARCAGASSGQGAAAASGGRDGAGTRGQATTDPLRVAWLLLVPPAANKGMVNKTYEEYEYSRVSLKENLLEVVACEPLVYIVSEVKFNEYTL